MSKPVATKPPYELPPLPGPDDMAEITAQLKSLLRSRPAYKGKATTATKDAEEAVNLFEDMGKTNQVDQYIINFLDQKLEALVWQYDRLIKVNFSVTKKVPIFTEKECALH